MSGDPYVVPDIKKYTSTIYDTIRFLSNISEDMKKHDRNTIRREARLYLENYLSAVCDLWDTVLEKRIPMHFGLSPDMNSCIISASLVNGTIALNDIAILPFLGTLSYSDLNHEIQDAMNKFDRFVKSNSVLLKAVESSIVIYVPHRSSIYYLKKEYCGKNEGANDSLERLKHYQLVSPYFSAYFSMLLQPIHRGLELPTLPDYLLDGLLFHAITDTEGFTDDPLITLAIDELKQVIKSIKNPPLIVEFRDKVLSIIDNLSIEAKERENIKTILSGIKKAVEKRIQKREKGKEKEKMNEYYYNKMSAVIFEAILEARRKKDLNISDINNIIAEASKKEKEEIEKGIENLIYLVVEKPTVRETIEGLLEDLVELRGLRESLGSLVTFVPYLVTASPGLWISPNLNASLSMINGIIDILGIYIFVKRVREHGFLELSTFKNLRYTLSRYRIMRGDKITYQLYNPIETIVSIAEKRYYKPT